MHPFHAAIVAALVAALSTPAEAGLCTRRNGTVVFRKRSCKAKEAAFALAVQDAKGDTGSRGVSQPRIRVVDATGQRLPGSVNQQGELVFPLGEVIFGVDALAAGFGQGGILFEAQGCTGPPLVFASEYDLYGKARVLGTTAYHANGPVALHTLESMLAATTPQDCTGTGKAYDQATGLCCSNASISTMAAPAASTDLNGFVPPFRVEVEE
jgi:hypothetical protein